MVTTTRSPMTNRYRMRAIKTRRIYTHRLIAEQALGRPLDGRHPVHHVDNDESNNDRKNLVICEDAAYHQLLHRRAAVVRVGGNPNTHRFCGSCSTAKPNHDFALRRDGQADGRSSQCLDCGARLRQPKPERTYTKDASEIAEIRALIRSGIPNGDIARAMSVTTAKVRRIRQRKVHVRCQPCHIRGRFRVVDTWNDGVPYCESCHDDLGQALLEADQRAWHGGSTWMGR